MAFPRSQCPHRECIQKLEDDGEIVKKDIKICIPNPEIWNEKKDHINT